MQGVWNINSLTKNFKNMHRVTKIAIMLLLKDLHLTQTVSISMLCPREYLARSHEKSVSNTGMFSMKQLMDDLLKIMETEKIPKAVFIGQSMGGNLAQDIAYYYPKKVFGLVLIDCTNNTAKLSRTENLMLSFTKSMFTLYPWKTLIKQSADACGLRQEVKKYVAECFFKVGKEALIDILIEVTKCLHEDATYKIKVPFLYSDDTLWFG